MLIKNLTLIIFIHSKFDSIEFFDSIFSNIKKGNIIFVIDEEENKLTEKQLNIIKKYKYKIIGKNIGKLKSLLMCVEQISTKFFKIIDQDDSIYIKGLLNVDKKLKEVNHQSLVKHRGIKINNKSKWYKQSLSEEILEKQTKIGKDSRLYQQTNFDTIYPTSVIKRMSEIDLTRQEFHNDILLSNFCIGMKSDLVEIDSLFYIHFHKAGQTRKYNISRAWGILELYENYKIIIKSNKNFDFHKIMNNSKIKHLIYIYWFSKWYTRKYDKKIGKNIYKETVNLLESLLGE